jgi:hypothetical protein
MEEVVKELGGISDIDGIWKYFDDRMCVEVAYPHNRLHVLFELWLLGKDGQKHVVFCASTRTEEELYVEGVIEYFRPGAWLKYFMTLVFRAKRKAQERIRIEKEIARQKEITARKDWEHKHYGPAEDWALFPEYKDFDYKSFSILDEMNKISRQLNGEIVAPVSSPSDAAFLEEIEKLGEDHLWDCFIEKPGSHEV